MPYHGNATLDIQMLHLSNIFVLFATKHVEIWGRKYTEYSLDYLD